MKDVINKKGVYIFITMGIHHAGGVQCYVAAKAQYLESQNWDVFVFSSFYNRVTECVNPLLNKYLNQRIKGLYLPPQNLPKWMVKHALYQMIEHVGSINSEMDIIVESHDSCTCPWGELLAEKIHARHYFYTMNERFRQPDQTYLQQIDLYLYKYRRKEILGGVKSVGRLLEGFHTIDTIDLPGTLILDEAPIQDVDSPKINSIQRYDWNICYIGRCNKQYVSSVFNGVREFAQRYPEKRIQFIVVGEIGKDREILCPSSTICPNLTITELGFLHPIPLSLYSKVDVVIAGSGSARHSAEVGALVILTDAETDLANGLLGYDTMSSLYRDKESVCTSYADALERALVKKDWMDKVNRFPKRKSISESVNHQFDLCSKSERKLEYFDSSKLLYGKIKWKSIVANFVRQNFPYFSTLIYHRFYGHN